MKRASTSLPVPLSPRREHGHVALRDARRELEQLAAQRILGDGQRDRGRSRGLGREFAAASVARDALLELFGLERLDEIVDGAVAHRGDGLIDRAVRRHQQHRRRRRALLQSAQQLAAVDGLHLHVADDEVDGRRAEDLQRLAAVAGSEHVETRRLRAS